MIHWPVRFMCVLLVLLAFPNRSPAPLIYSPTEGWRYEQVGEGAKWHRSRAKDQLEVAQEAFDKQDYSLALKAAQRTLKVWPFSDDYAPQAQYIVARCYDAQGEDERAFKAYQNLLEKYPKIGNFNDIVTRQYIIATRFLKGQWFKIWNRIPFFPSMDKTIKMYDQIIKNGPYSEVAPYAQMNIGSAHENKLFAEYPEAAKAYERAADRYSEHKVGTDALFKVGETYNKQAKKAEYDQSVAAQAISTFTDFITLHPNDTRVSQAQSVIQSLKTEQARGSFDIARYYERHHRWEGAKIYYNDVVSKDPNSKYAQDAKSRIDAINKHVPK
jgi:outer membrane protein assembly factor BamD (BamD/ComL family)